MSTITYEEVLSLLRETSYLIKEQSREFDRRLKETDRQMKETDRRIEETDRQMKETDRQIKELGRQIGGLGDKFGYFTEGMALPSMERILMERFGMTTIMPRVRTRKDGEEIQIDVLAYANGTIDLAVVVEVKSRVKRDAVEQLRKVMVRFHEFYPEYRDKAVMGILAGIDWDRGVAEEAREAGFPTASIRGDMFELTTPEGFEARKW